MGVPTRCAFNGFMCRLDSVEAQHTPCANVNCGIERRLLGAFCSYSRTRCASLPQLQVLVPKRSESRLRQTCSQGSTRTRPLVNSRPADSGKVKLRAANGSSNDRVALADPEHALRAAATGCASRRCCGQWWWHQCGYGYGCG